MSLLDILYTIFPALRPPQDEPPYREYNATLPTYLHHWPTMTAREIQNGQADLFWLFQRSNRSGAQYLGGDRQNPCSQSAGQVQCALPMDIEGYSSEYGWL